MKALAGQEVKVRLEINRVMRQSVPELDDELAGKIGMESVQEVESVVRERLGAALEQRQREITRQMAVRRLLEGVPLDLPPSLVERAAAQEQARALVRMLRQGVPRQEAERRAERGAGRIAQRHLDRLVGLDQPVIDHADDDVLLRNARIECQR